MFDKLKKILKKKKYLDCTHMKHSLHFFHDEIRTCCTCAKGPILYPDYEGSVVDWDYVFEKRKSCVKKINSIFTEEVIPSECKGCYEITNFLSDKKIKLFKNMVNRIIIQNFMTCNAKCSYCNFAYEDKKLKYNVVPLIRSLIDKGIMAKDCYVFLSGGEITISPEFEELFSMIVSYVDIHCEIATSGIKYSPLIREAFEKDKLTYLISLDSGTRETYKKIKNVDMFDTVIDNLKKYTKDCDSAKRNIILKYIIVDEVNDNIEELARFFDIVNALGVLNVRMDVNCQKYSGELGQKIPSSYKKLYSYFKQRANELNLVVYSSNEMEILLKNIN